MARLVSPPAGLRAHGVEPRSGPQTIGGGDPTLGNFIQTVASPFFLWSYRLIYPPQRGMAARRYRGWVASLHGGANATRIALCDLDGLTYGQAGVRLTETERRGGIPWSNGTGWSNGRNWKPGKPSISVAANAGRDATLISLSDAFWGHNLDVGDRFGFYPFHLGVYEVTEVIEPGRYRLHPPLRKAITTEDYATLAPVMAMRMHAEGAATGARDAFNWTGLSLTLVEVLDYDARDFFAD